MNKDKKNMADITAIIYNTATKSATVYPNDMPLLPKGMEYIAGSVQNKERKPCRIVYYSEVYNIVLAIDEGE